MNYLNIEIEKGYGNFKRGESFIISIDLLEEIDIKLWDEFLK